MIDKFWMQKAFDLACLARVQGEVPVGAVLINEYNQCIGQGFNQVVQTSDATAHAEIVAIRNACVHLKNYRLHNTTLYVTLEPCCMCAGALLHARIRRVVFAARDIKSGAAGSMYNFLNSDALNHAVQIDDGCLQDECAQLLKNFFQSRR